MSTAAVLVLGRFLILALVAVCTMAALTAFGATALRTALHNVTRDSPDAVEATWVAAAARSEASAPGPESLHVHVQKPAVLHAGGESQLRLMVDGGSSLDRSRDATAVSPLLLVELAMHNVRSGEGSVSVTPTQLVVTRGELRSIPIWIQVAADVPCWSNAGELHVHVRELAGERARAEAIVALPPVDCRAAPPVLDEPR